MAHTATPALHADNRIAFVQDVEPDGLLDAPFQAVVNIHLPRFLLEIRFLLREEEGIDTAVEMGVLRCHQIYEHSVTRLQDLHGPGMRYE